MLRRLSRDERWRVAHRPLAPHRSGNLNFVRTEPLTRVEFVERWNSIEEMLEEILREAKEVE